MDESERKRKKAEYNRQYHLRRYYGDPEFRARRLAYRGRTPEESAAYMREYYRKHVEDWKEYSREYRPIKNAARNSKYASDPEYRERAKARQREYCRRNADAVRDRKLREKYGVGLAECAAILDSQGGVCAVCGRESSVDRDHRTGKQRRLHVDHCHESGRVRGLLCSSCNLGLGKFGHDPERLERAAAYLRRQR